MFLFCLVFAMFCARLFVCASWSPAGKGLASWLSFVVSSVSLSLSHWYPGSGVVLDCIDSWSLQPYLLLFRWRHTDSTYTWRHSASTPYDFNFNLPPVCAINVLLNNEQIMDHFPKQLCLRVITLWNYDVILKTKWKVCVRRCILVLL